MTKRIVVLEHFKINKFPLQLLARRVRLKRSALLSAIIQSRLPGFLRKLTKS